MDSSVINKEVLNQLMHERNLIMVRKISELTIKDKRKVYNALRQLPSENSSYLFPMFFGATVGEFCTVQVLMSDSKRKFKEYGLTRCQARGPGGGPGVPTEYTE